MKDERVREEVLILMDNELKLVLKLEIGVVTLIVLGMNISFHTTFPIVIKRGQGSWFV